MASSKSKAQKNLEWVRKRFPYVKEGKINENDPIVKEMQRLAKAGYSQKEISEILNNRLKMNIQGRKIKDKIKTEKLITGKVKIPLLKEVDLTAKGSRQTGKAGGRKGKYIEKEIGLNFPHSKNNWEIVYGKKEIQDGDNIHEGRISTDVPGGTIVLSGSKQGKNKEGRIGFNIPIENVYKFLGYNHGKGVFNKKSGGKIDRPIGVKIALHGYGKAMKHGK